MNTERLIWQSPWVEMEHLGKRYLSARRIIFYEEECSEVEEWQDEDGWYVAHFMIDDTGEKELDGSNETWETGGIGIHWPTEIDRAQNWYRYVEWMMKESEQE
tara:strand:+ start:2609 stop:2917 length:309 start_codon:yes stop_codon:yes gene_type:complete